MPSYAHPSSRSSGRATFVKLATFSAVLDSSTSSSSTMTDANLSFPQKDISFAQVDCPQEATRCEKNRSEGLRKRKEEGKYCLPCELALTFWCQKQLLNEIKRTHSSQIWILRWFWWWREPNRRAKTPDRCAVNLRCELSPLYRTSVWSRKRRNHMVEGSPQFQTWTAHTAAYN